MKFWSSGSNENQNFGDSIYDYHTVKFGMIDTLKEQALYEYRHLYIASMSKANIYRKVLENMPLRANAAPSPLFNPQVLT